VLKVYQWSGDGPGSAASHTVMPRIAVVELHHDRAPLRRLNTASCLTSSPQALGRGPRMVVSGLRQAGDHGRRHPPTTAARRHRRSPGRPRPGTPLDVARGRGTGRPRVEPRPSGGYGSCANWIRRSCGATSTPTPARSCGGCCPAALTNWTASRRASAGERARDPSAGVVLNSTRPAVWAGGAECRRPSAEQAHCCARRGPARLRARSRRLGGRWPCSTVQPRTAPPTVSSVQRAVAGAVSTARSPRTARSTRSRRSRSIRTRRSVCLPRWGSTPAVANFR
jgi:hypothetical protein